jgi:NAD(P)H-quinone oxidoreductase subunit 5
LGIAIVTAVVLSFACVTFLLGMVPARPGTGRWQRLYAHISNGFYVNTLANRLVVAFWPSRRRARLPVAL